MWELDNKKGWVLKNWCFQTAVLEKTLESSLDCKVIKPVHPKEISSEYSLEGLMLKLKLQYFGHLMRRTDSLERLWCWERLKARREGDDRGWDGWMESLTQWTWVWASSVSCWWAGKPGVLLSMGLQRVAHDWAPELNWTLSWHLVFHHPLGEKNGNPLQYFGHLMRRVHSFEKTLMLGKIEGRRRRGQQRMRWLDGITDSMDMT